MTKKPKPKGGSPGDDYTGKNKDDKDWPPKPKPIKQAKKNKGKKGDPEKPYSQPLPGAPTGHNISTSPNDNNRKYA